MKNNLSTQNSLLLPQSGMCARILSCFSNIFSSEPTPTFFSKSRVKQEVLDRTPLPSDIVKIIVDYAKDEKKDERVASHYSNDSFYEHEDYYYYQYSTKRSYTFDRFSKRFR